MARRIEEGDLLSVDGNHIRADVLRDASGLPVGDMGIPDRIQQGRLAVIDMTHHADDRRSRDEILLILRVLRQKLADDILLLFLLAEDVVLHRDFLCLLIRKLVVHGDHLALHEEFLDQDGRRQLHLLGQLADRDLVRYLDGRYLLFLLLLMLRLTVLQRLRDPVELPSLLIRTVAALAPVLPALLSCSLALLAVLAEITGRLVRQRAVPVTSGRCGAASGTRSVLTEARTALTRASVPIRRKGVPSLAVSGSHTRSALTAAARALAVPGSGSARAVTETAALARASVPALASAPRSGAG